MNPVAAIDALAREPLATLQALAEQLNPPIQTLGQQASLLQQHAPQGALPASAMAEAAAVAEPRAPLLDAAQAEAVATAQAQHGRQTLGQMAQQPPAAQLQADAALAPAQPPAGPNTDPTGPAAKLALAAPQLLQAEAAAPASASVLAVPVLLQPLQSLPTPFAARHATVQAEPLQRQRGEQQSDEDPPAQPEQEQRQAQDHSAATDDPSPTSVPAGDHTQLLNLLRTHAGSAVQRELQAGRRVLVVVPQDGQLRGLAPARATLLGLADSSLFVHARWWPGEVPLLEGPASGEAIWPQWRVFREGDPLRAHVLVARGQARACRVLLGSTAPQLLDSRSALLELPDRQRFVQALGRQWSLLLVLAPVGQAL